MPTEDEPLQNAIAAWIVEWHRRGTAERDIAVQLNECGLRGPRGGLWRAEPVSGVLRRAEEDGRW